MLLYWVWISQLKGLSPLQKQQALSYFPNPLVAYNSNVDRLDMPEKLKEALGDKDLTEAQQILIDCRALGISILTIVDRAYPAALRCLPDAPLVLYYKGRLPDWGKQPVIGVVGTRHTTGYGNSMAIMFGQQIAACGALVISGGAVGVDTCAMQGALEVGAPTVAVLGCGVDVIYPAENKALFRRAQENGCLISEYPPGTRGNRWTFPARNRIIAGICNALVIIEAPRVSGALITARHALTIGREVFVVPGNIDLPSCAGSNALLREGGIAAFCGWDVVSEFVAQWPHLQNCRPVLKQTQTLQSVPSDKKAIDKDEKSTYSVLDSKKPDIPDDERSIMALLGREPILLDQLIDRLDMSAAAVKMILTKLSIKGLVVMHPGGRVSLK